MTQKTVFIAGFLLFACRSGLFAQGTEQIEMHALHLKEKLALSQEQTVQVRGILQSHDEKRKKEEAGKQVSRRERIKASLARMERVDAEIERLLTKDQKKKFEQYKDERRIEMRERMKERQL